MGSHILVPFDGSTPARHALEYALENFSDADITVLTVVDNAAYSPDHFAPAEMGKPFVVAKRRLEDAEAIADEYGVAVDCVMEAGATCPAITAYADAAGVDHVVMGTHGRTGISRIIVGSVAETVARRSSAPVTTVK